MRRRGLVSTKFRTAVASNGMKGTREIECMIKFLNEVVAA